MFKVGKEYHRQSEIHGVYKGQAQGGISTPSGLDVIFIFTGDGGEKHGYADDFGDDGIFYYTGEGQEGDMEMVRGNKAILNNMKDGRTIHIFEYVRKAYVRYNGSADCIGYHEEQRPDTHGNMRNAFIFHLMMHSQDEVEASTDHLPEVADVSKAQKPIEKELKKLKTLAELRKAALSTSSSNSDTKTRQVATYYRSEALKKYVKARAKGNCEGCDTPAPFETKKGPYLEPHHVHRLADGGPDHPKFVIALCPTCHRRAHYAVDAAAFNQTLIEKLVGIEG